MKPDQVQAILQLLADVLVQNDYAASVVCIAQGEVAGRTALVFAKAPDVVELQISAEGAMTTAIIGPRGEQDLLAALRATLAAFEDLPAADDDAELAGLNLTGQRPS